MAAGIQTVGIISKPRPGEVRQLLTDLMQWLTARGLTVHIDTETARSLHQPHAGLPRESFPDPLDLVIVLGGDGTLLAAARALGGRDIPVLAVNLGNLGFLTSVTLDLMYPMLEAVLAGSYDEDIRRFLRMDLIRDGQILETHHALNDVVLNKSAIARILDFEVAVDGQHVSTYKADGMIFSTPTGSTAYSMAAGGPITFPTVRALLITPICPHALNHRPLVLPDDATIEVSVRSHEEKCFLTSDGQVGMPVEHEDRLVCRRSDRTLRLVRPHGMGYFEILRSKLMWGQR